MRLVRGEDDLVPGSSNTTSNLYMTEGKDNTFSNISNQKIFNFRGQPQLS